MQEITGGHRYMGKVKITAEVVSQTCIATDIYSLILKAGEIVSQAVAGQFVSVYSKDGSRMLPRPISLCGIDKEAGTLRLVYRIAGKGTNEFSKLQAGDTVDILGPLGNGFMKESGKAILIGGGIGIPRSKAADEAMNLLKNTISQLFYFGDKKSSIHFHIKTPI